MSNIKTCPQITNKIQKTKVQPKAKITCNLTLTKEISSQIADTNINKEILPENDINMVRKQSREKCSAKYLRDIFFAQVNTALNQINNLQLNRTPEQMINMISGMEVKQRRLLWDYLENSITPHKPYKNYRDKFTKYCRDSQSKSKRLTEIERNINIIINFYKKALNQTFNQDFEVYTSQKVIEKVQVLTKEEQIIFWQNFHLLQPKTSIHCQKEYFRTRAQQVLFSERLSLKDKFLIKKYCLENDKQGYTDIATNLFDNYFANRNIFYWEIHRYAMHCKVYEMNKHNDRQNHGQNLQIMQAYELIDSYTLIYKHGLQEILKIDTTNFTPSQICQKINSMSRIDNKQFWKYLESVVQPKKTIHHFRRYYNNTYKRVLYPNRLTDDDKLLIIKQCSQITLSNATTMAKQIYNQYFVGNHIFFRDVYEIVFKTLLKFKQQSNTCSQMNLINQKQINKKERDYLHTIAYKKGLQMILDKDCSNLTNKQICQYILRLNTTDRKDFWKYILEKYSTSFGKDYFRTTFQQALYSYTLTEEDQQHIYKYLQECSNMTITQIVQQLMNGYFKNKDVFYWDVYYKVRTKSRQNKLDNKQNNEQQTQTQINKQQTINMRQLVYINSLQQITKNQCSNLTLKQLCEQILSLDSTQSQQFWKIVSNNIKPKKSPDAQKVYFHASFLQVMYSYSLTNEDKEQIYKYLRENDNLTQTEATQNIINEFFKDKDVFYYNVYKIVNNKRFKQRCISQK
ncbi:Hypothetical_protein [Hexamita inflata]|uniref:Hypothetical_protein n=1 Tax=Hexamita inflata TaxID=28002 RepID=A0AA86QDX8_9EUKA|nr:Hypothetical protein HINF_LOCUS42072 [Hexamita inflata]